MRPFIFERRPWQLDRGVRSFQYLAFCLAKECFLVIKLAIKEERVSFCSNYAFVIRPRLRQTADVTHHTTGRDPYKRQANLFQAKHIPGSTLTQI